MWVSIPMPVTASVPDIGFGVAGPGAATGLGAGAGFGTDAGLGTGTGVGAAGFWTGVSTGLAAG